MSGGLARDGSTRIGDLISVSKLSILSSGVNEQLYPKKQQCNPVIFTGAENQMPKGSALV